MTSTPDTTSATGAKPQRGSATGGRASSISQHMMEEIRGRAADIRSAEHVPAWLSARSYDNRAVCALAADCLALLSALQAAQARVGVLEGGMRMLVAGLETVAPFAKDGLDNTLVKTLVANARQALSEGD